MLHLLHEVFQLLTILSGAISSGYIENFLRTLKHNWLSNHVKLLRSVHFSGKCSEQFQEHFYRLEQG